MTRHVGWLMILWTVSGATLGCGTRRDGSPPPGTPGAGAGDSVPAETGAGLAHDPARAEADTTAASRAAVAAAVAGHPTCTIPADVTQNLMAMVSRGRGLLDHVGPDQAAAIYADLARRTSLYLDAFECSFVTPAPKLGLFTLFLSEPLWRVRKQEPRRVQALAARAGYRYDELSRQVAVVPGAPQPVEVQQLAERVFDMALLRDGIDVPAGPNWRPVTRDLTACVTSTPEGVALVHVTYECTCGEPVSCRARVRGGRLEVDVRYDPDAPRACDDCYAKATSCTLPALPAQTGVDVVLSGKKFARWNTNVRGMPPFTAVCH